MKTFSPRQKDVSKKWYIVDAKDKVVGRLAAKIAHVLIGKHKPIYSPHVDTGDNIIVINADKVVFTGKKLDSKIYYRHSGYPGGLTSTTAAEMLEKKPEFVLHAAVKGMLPKNKLASKMINNLKIYASPEHPHVAQTPQLLEV